ncbi:MAG TPA: hypothetical protein VEG35_03210 [Burkholderiales bacterium]|nr:hypothetical protein [Burkholderiales bacterium]
MPKPRRKPTSIVLFMAVAVLAFGAVWAILSVFHDRYADWLTVETPRAAVVGQPFDFRVSVHRASEPSVLDISVYVLGWNLVPVGRLSGFHFHEAVHAGDTREFRLDVKPVDKMAYIQFVLWLSPTGDWNMRTAGADTAPVPVRTGKLSNGGGWRKLPAFVNNKARHPDARLLAAGRPPESGPYRASSSPFRAALAALLVLGGLVILFGPVRRDRKAKEGSAAGVPPAGSGKEHRAWTAIAVLSFLLAMSEVFLLEGRVAGWGRGFVYRLGLYNFRQIGQKAGLALAAAALAVLLLLAAQTLGRRRALAPLVVAATAMAGYLVLALAGALSFHYVDIARRISLAGLSLVDAVKAVCAAAVLLVGVLELRGRNAAERKK